MLPAIEEKLGMKLDCVHPMESLLAKAPPFERSSRFKAPEGGKSGGRPKGKPGGRPRRR